MNTRLRENATATRRLLTNATVLSLHQGRRVLRAICLVGDWIITLTGLKSKMTISIDEAKLLSRLACSAEEKATEVEKTRDFFVLDARKSRRVWHSVHLRSWASDGIRVLSLNSRPQREGISTYIVTDKREEELDGDLVALKREVTHLVIETSQCLLFQDIPLHSYREVSFPLETPTINIAGLNEVARRRLPLTVTATLHSNEEYSSICVSGTTERGKALVPEQTFRLTGAGEVDLLIDVEPSVDGDRWVVKAVKGGKEMPPKPQVSKREIRTLIVVFDRTCPDSNKWLAAKSSLSEARTQKNPIRNVPLEEQYDPRKDRPGVDVASTAESSVPAQQRDASGATYVLTDLNKEIKAGLHAGLTRAKSEIPELTAREVHLVSFADTAHGLAPPRGFDMPADPVTVEHLDLSMLQHKLSNIHYCCGMDLWDCLDEALFEVEEKHLVKDPDRTAILIIGNSPPKPPIKRNERYDSTFNSILTLPGSKSTFRKLGTFPESVRRLKGRGVSLAYLFLGGHCPASRVDPAFERYKTLQELVYKAIEHCGVHVIASEATSADIDTGTSKAIEYLAAPSWVAVDVKEEA